MNVIDYLLEANLYLVAFYLLYVLLLRSETLYQLNRAYLLITTAIAFIIPLLQLGILKPDIKAMVTVGTVSVGEGITTAKVLPGVAQTTSHWTMADYALALYAAAALVLFMLFIFKIVKLISLSKKGIARPQNGFTLIEIPGQNVAFSFFGYLFVNTELLSSPTILRHEEVHIRQKHSWDVVYFEFMKIINWFNPVVYLLQKSLKEVHEFIADQYVASLESGASDYADFLISNAYGLNPIQLTNSFFNKNLLKRRIIMLYQKRSGKAARLKYLVTLPLTGGLLCLSTMAFTNKTYGLIDLDPVKSISRPTAITRYAPKQNDPANYTAPGESVSMAPNGIVAAPTGSQTEQLITAPGAHPTLPDTIYKKVEVLPMFPGGYQAFGEFLRDNIRYPKTAKDANVQGRVFVKFIVEKDGSLTDMKILRDPGSGLGEEAVRVLSLSPKWTPGMQKGQPVRVAFTVPVNFALDDNKTTPTGQSTPPPSNKIQDVQLNAPAGNAVYTAVENQPTFPGGEKAFGDFLVHHIKYPKEAKETGVTGRVFIQFIVEADGSLSDMKILRDPGKGLGDEALRVLSLSPKWKPGMQNGKPVRVQYTVPINFSLADDYGKNDIGTLYYAMAKIKYPQDAIDKNLAGREFVSFTLGANKEIQNIKILRSANKLFEDAVVNTLQNFKTLTDGKPGVTYVMPVNFSIDAIKNKRLFDPSGYKSHPSDYQPNDKNQVNMYEVVVFGYK